MRAIFFTSMAALSLIIAWLWLSDPARQQALELAMGAEARLAGFERKALLIAEHELVYLERPGSHANAELLLLIHGFTADKNHWLRFSRAISEDFRIIAVDLPAHGESTYLPDGDYRVATQADRLLALLDMLGVERAHLVGNSMGGAIAANFASRFDDRVLSLILMNAGGADNPATQSPVEMALSEGRNPLLVQKPEDFMRTFYMAMEQPPWTPWPLTAAMASTAASRYEQFEFVSAQIQSSVANRDVEYLTRVRAPALIIWGDHDRLLDVGNAEVFAAALPESETIIYPGIGHLPMLELPKRSAMDVEAFIQRRRL